MRGLAAFMVFIWHFTHGSNGSPVPFEGAPIPPLSIFDEGHVGVALFMTLSGYLFAKLLDGQSVRFGNFLLNRALRLFPLLCVVLLAVAAREAIVQQDIRVAYWSLLDVPRGFIAPQWPNGGWSITVELHFYLLLPLLLFVQRRAPIALLSVVVLALALRTGIYMARGEVHYLAYHTIIGRIDQFVLGMLAFSCRDLLRNRHAAALVTVFTLMAIYYLFDIAGGFYGLRKSPLWIGLAPLEGLAFGILIAWYETSFPASSGPVSTMASKIGEYSYSIYLLHFFVVFLAADYIHRHVVDLSNFYVAMLAGSIVFTAMIPVGYLSMRFIEAPFLRLRRPYLRRG